VLLTRLGEIVACSTHGKAARAFGERKLEYMGNDGYHIYWGSYKSFSTRSTIPLPVASGNKNQT
jgi:hypothetical protein